jgi:hypothetical protein
MYCSWVARALPCVKLQSKNSITAALCRGSPGFAGKSKKVADSIGKLLFVSTYRSVLHLRPIGACGRRHVRLHRRRDEFSGRVLHHSRVWGLRGIWVSGGEAEGLHFVGVLSFGDEFREDGGFGGIQEKFWEALA